MCEQDGSGETAQARASLCCTHSTQNLEKVLHKSNKKAKISNRYNQVTRDTIWESDKNTRTHHTHERKEVSPFPAGDRKAARNKTVQQRET